MLLLTGCTQVIHDAKPRAQAPVAPITESQVADLLSEDAAPDDDPNTFVTVVPEECAGVAREVDPPFIFARKPAASDGGQYFAEYSRSISVLEWVGVYRADFDARAAVDGVKRAIESCQDTRLFVTALKGDELQFSVQPQTHAGSPEIVLWSLTDVDWACDNAFVAKHNAAIEITTCGEVNGYDVLALAEDALKRIEKLVNAKA